MALLCPSELVTLRVLHMNTLEHTKTHTVQYEREIFPLAKKERVRK